jgi:hypothetical protein
MKLNTLIENKLILEKKAYIRFPSEEKETNYSITDNSTNLSLIHCSKNTSTKATRVVSYSNIKFLKYRNFKNLKALQNCDYNLKDPKIVSAYNKMFSNKKSATILRPIKNGFLLLLSNGTLGFVSMKDVIKVTKLTSLMKNNKIFLGFNCNNNTANKTKAQKEVFKMKFTVLTKNINLKFVNKKNLINFILKINLKQDINYANNKLFNEIKKNKI